MERQERKKLRKMASAMDHYNAIAKIITTYRRNIGKRISAEYCTEGNKKEYVLVDQEHIDIGKANVWTIKRGKPPDVVVDEDQLLAYIKDYLTSPDFNYIEVEYYKGYGPERY